MNGVVGQRKLILTLTLLLSALGLVSWLTMSRQEDPRLPEYWGLATVSFPGADAETVERLVLEPLEDHLAEVDELHEIVATAQAELAVLDLRLADRVEDTSEGWDRVREALDDARAELPEGAGEPHLDDRNQDQTSVVYALTGPADPLVLGRAARDLKHELLAVPGVTGVEVLADPGEQITVELDDAAGRRLGLTADAVAAQLAGRTRILPGGSLRVDQRQVRLRPDSDYRSVEEIRATPLRLPGGDASAGEVVPLSSVARVRHGIQEPARSRMRHRGQPAVGVGVIPRKAIHLVEFGERVQERVDAFAPELAKRGVEIHRVIYQPARVAARLSSLSRSLLSGALVVAGMLVVFMGLRLGLLVASVVPLVTLSSLAIFALGGGTLHQMSIAAVVIALGMLVDNAVVMAESIQRRIDEGAERGEAATAAIRELAVPLAAATGTTLAAFLPMLLAPGVTAEFTRAIPVMILLTLAMSYVFAVFVTPTLSAAVLRPRPVVSGTFMERAAEQVGRLATGRPWWVLAAAGLTVALSLTAAGMLRQEFFPSSDRNQLVVDLKLPEGSHLEATDEAVARLEAELAESAGVRSVTSFIGRSAPHFYYNLNRVPWSPHYAQAVIETGSLAEVAGVIDRVREIGRGPLAGIEMVVRELEQGPPVAAPVEVRLYGRDLADLQSAAEQVMTTLRDVPGATDVRHDLSLGSPVLEVRVDEATAVRRGVDGAAVAGALFRTSRGLTVGSYRAGDDPVPVVLRSSAGEELPVAELAGLDVSAPGSSPVPLGQVARLEPVWRPAAIRHRNRRRLTIVSSQLLSGVTYSEVVDRLTPRLEELTLPAGVELEMGGAAESSGEANNAMMQSLPAGLLLLLGILMAEFRSFRRVGLVLVTVPLAAAGVVPGLLLGGQPFGFMSLLGTLALAGVVVNNAIVLLEVVEARRREGASPADAVREAVDLRLRPILLASGTTVVGLLPLALSDSTLWPPLAWALISGLTASTFLSLLVVPALYVLLFRDGERARSFRLVRRAAALLVLGLALAAPAPAQETLTFEQALARAATRPMVAAERHRAAALDEAARAEHLAARRPAVVGAAEARVQTLEPEIDTPIGTFPFGDRETGQATLTLLQPLWAPDRLRYRAPAARRTAEAAALEAERATQEAVALAAEVYLDALAVEARLDATEAFITRLRTSLDETTARVAAGRALESDGLKVRLALDEARRGRSDLLALRRVAQWELARVTGLPGPVAPAGPPPEPPADLFTTTPVLASRSGKTAASFPTSFLDDPDELGKTAASFSEALRRAQARRPDLQALELLLDARELAVGGVRAERLPRLDASVSGVWSSGTPYDETTWVEGGLRVTWSAFTGGVRSARLRAAEAERGALAATLEEARRRVALEVERALADWRRARAAHEVGESGMAQARESLRVEQERYRAGRVTSNDLLAAEAQLRDRRTVREIARLDLVRARMRFELATGVLVAGP